MKIKHYFKFLVPGWNFCFESWFFCRHLEKTVSHKTASIKRKFFSPSVFFFHSLRPLVPLPWDVQLSLFFQSGDLIFSWIPLALSWWLAKLESFWSKISIPPAYFPVSLLAKKLPCVSRECKVIWSTVEFWAVLGIFAIAFLYIKTK
jgi:hypothetical protein